jgi:hypothetical protein
MALQFSTTVRSNRLDSIETTVGVSAKLQIFTGAMPANCAAASTGTKLVEMALPSDWMAAAASGVKAKTGTWSGTGLAAGTAGYFRIVDNAGTTCHIQGTITATGGGGDMTLDNTNIAAAQSVVVSTFQLTDANS